jgi:hypothetical protein
VTFGNTFIFGREKLLYECEVLWNRIVKGVEIFFKKGFGGIYVKFMVGKWCDILVVHRQ